MSITGNKETEMAYALARNENHITKIIELKNESAEVIYSNDKNVNEFGSWALRFESGKIYLADTKIWSFDTVTKETKTLIDLPYGVGVLSITSNGNNDIFFWGNTYQNNDKLIHFNGNRYKEFELPFISDNYGGSFFTNEIGARVGFENNKAFIIQVKRR